MSKTFLVLATITAMAIGTASAAAGASTSDKRAAQKKTHVAQHSKPAAKLARSSKPSVAHHTTKPIAKSHKPMAHKPAAKSHAKPMTRLQKRHA